MNEATCPRAQERLKLAMRNVNRLRKLVDVSYRLARCGFCPRADSRVALFAAFVPHSVNDRHAPLLPAVDFVLSFICAVAS